MLYDVIGYSGEIIGQVKADDAVGAWSEARKRYENILDVRKVEQYHTRIYGQKLKVTTDAPLFYRYLTDREIEYRKRDHPLELADVTALGSHYGEFEISEEELDSLVVKTIRVDELWGAHHKVWIGRWELGMTWDNKLVYAKKLN